MIKTKNNIILKMSESSPITINDVCDKLRVDFEQAWVLLTRLEDRKLLLADGSGNEVSWHLTGSRLHRWI